MGRALTFSSLCSAPNCSRPRVKRQWCNAHYIRWRRYGDPLGGARARRPGGLTEAETFAWFMPGDPPPADQCWDWPAATVKGYGVLKGDQGLAYAHRVSYRIHHGPTGQEQVLHSCDRPICVQPAHLSLGGPPDNLRQAAERARMPRGERHHNAKLTEADVRLIRASSLPHRTLAESLGVSENTIRQIRVRTSWNWLL